MALLTPQQISIAGVAPVFTAASAGGDTVPAMERGFIVVRNGSGSSITATVVTPGTVSGLAIADIAVAVAAGADRYIGPLPLALVGDPASVTYSATATVSIAVLTV